jgi:phosphatidylglycerophosphate synthase
MVEVDGIGHDVPNIIQPVFDHFLRALKDRLLAPLARRVDRRLPPAVITLIAFCVGLAAAFSAARGAYHAALGLWWLNRFLDGFDGTLARVHGTDSTFGAYLDIVLDFVVYAAIPLGLVVGVSDPRAPLAGLLLLSSFYVNAATWMSLSGVRESPPALIAGAETVVFYSLFLALPQHLVPLFRIMAALVLLTAAQRLIWASRHLAK